MKEISPEVQIVELRAQNSYLSDRTLILSQAVSDLGREASALKDLIKQMEAVKSGDDAVIEELQKRIDALTASATSPLPWAGVATPPPVVVSPPPLPAVPDDTPLTSLAG